MTQELGRFDYSPGNIWKIVVIIVIITVIIILTADKTEDNEQAEGQDSEITHVAISLLMAMLYYLKKKIEIT